MWNRKYLVLVLILLLSVVLIKKTETRLDINETQKQNLYMVQIDDAIHVPSSTSNRGKWRLVWSDEFQNDSSLDNWNLQDWPSEKNEELQYYSPENIKVTNDFLVLESRKEKYKGREYTSGAITTQDKFEFMYGKIDIKAKLPKGKGIFPAFWLVNSNNDNWLPEIDIMENLGQSPNELYFVVHWENYKGEKMRDYTHYISDSKDFSNTFHNYGLIWEKDKIIWTIDNKIVFETQEFSPNEPLFLYLNTAIGGVWPGEPDPFDNYPKAMKIDYVRVYMLNEGD